jgi:hypothetical protein
MISSTKTLSSLLEARARSINFCRSGSRTYNPDQYEGLVALLDSVPDGGLAVEIGVFEGDATEFFAAKFDKVYAVDLWEGPQVPWLQEPFSFADAEALFDARALPNVVKMKMDSVAASLVLPSVDFVYIDAGHTYEEALRDIDAWSPKTKIMAGHDYGPWFPGVVKAVRERFPKHAVYRDSSWKAL